jgi:hypothetical protein
MHDFNAKKLLKNWGYFYVQFSNKIAQSKQRPNLPNLVTLLCSELQLG